MPCTKRDGLIIRHGTQSQGLVDVWVEVDGGALACAHEPNMAL